MKHFRHASTSGRPIGHNALIFLILRVVGAAITYAFLMIVARLTQIEDFGVLVLIFSSSLLLANFASFGQQQALVRYLPPMLRDADHTQARAFIRASLRLVVTTNFALWCPLSIAAVAAGSIFHRPEYFFLPIGLLIIPLTAIADFQAYLARAYKAITLTVIPKDIAWRLLSLLTLLLTTIFVRPPLPLWFVFSALVIVLVATIILTSIVGRKFYNIPDVHELLSEPQGTFRIAQLKDSHFSFWITSLTSVALANIDVVIIGMLIGPEAAALYFAANRIAQAPNFFEQSYAVVISPVFSEHASSGKFEELRAAAIQGAWQSFWPTFILAMILGLFAPQILHFFGDGFEEAHHLLLILLVAAVLNVAFGPADLLLSMSGHEASAMRVGLYSTIAGIFIISIGTLAGQAAGGAIGCLLSVTLRKWWFWHVAKTKLGILTDIMSASSKRMTFKW